jgi:hypothetical protein
MPGARAATIMRRGEKTVMASRRRTRMIMAVLRGWVGPIVAVFVAIFIAIFIAMIVTAHHRMIVVMFFRLLFVMVFRAILSAKCQRDHGGQRKSRSGENYRFPSVITHV